MAVEYSFGDMFMAAYQNRQKQMQDQQQFEAKMIEEQRQFGLLDAFRNKQLSQEDRQFNQTLNQRITENQSDVELKKQSINNDYTLGKERNDLTRLNIENDFTVGQGGLLARNKELGLGYGKLNEDKRQFDETMKYNYTALGMKDSLERFKAGNDEQTQKDLSKLKGGMQQSLDMLKNENYGENATYQDVKSNATAMVTDALNKVGIPINSAVVNELRSVINQDDPPEVKRALLNEAIFQLKDQFTPEQIEVLKYWAELGTR